MKLNQETKKQNFHPVGLFTIEKKMLVRPISWHSCLSRVDCWKQPIELHPTSSQSDHVIYSTESMTLGDLIRLQNKLAGQCANQDVSAGRPQGRESKFTKSKHHHHITQHNRSVETKNSYTNAIHDQNIYRTFFISFNLYFNSTNHTTDNLHKPRKKIFVCKIVVVRTVDEYEN